MRHGNFFATTRTQCPACPWTGVRVRHDDGPRYGLCPRCGTAVRRATPLADRQAAKARRDLAEQWQKDMT
jgi:hypothetical protein